ncbi:MAG TPA: AarF/UbiB family protein [Actinomycetes bacterium]|nr:AarF/UbiB family protein [Actinomycetes bacterium]
MRAAFVPVLTLVALVGMRLLGVRLGWWRAVAVAWLGLATAGLFLNSLSRANGGGPPPLVLVVGVGLLAMMAWAGVFELLSSSLPEPARQSLANPVEALRGQLARGRRSAEIAAIAARFGLGRFGRPHAPQPRGSATGRSLRAALEQAGGVYVKLGQFLSTRPDLLPPEIIGELRRLQQTAAPAPRPLVDQVFVEELGSTPVACFATFDADPAAAASIAQVHRAVLPDGRRVAVKIQRPQVAERVRRDLDILIRLATRLERRTKWALDLRLAETMRGFAESVNSELDFTAEARNLAAVHTAIQAHARFLVPRPVPDLTRRRVLVMDWVDGSPLADAAAALTAEDRRQLARALLRCFLDQILIVGTFHADPHPGNLYLTGDHRIALLDCGSVGRLDRRQRSALQAVLVAIAAQDAAQLRDGLRRITTATGTVDGALLEQALGNLLSHHLVPGTPASGALLSALMDVLREFRLALEPVVGGALRALAILQSTFELLAPDLDLVEEARSYGHTLLQPPWSPTSPRSPRDELQSMLPLVLPTLLALPRRLDRISEAVERNQISIGVHLFPDQRDRRFIIQLTAQLLVTIAGAATGLVGALLILAANPRIATTTGQVLQGLGIGCVVVAALVLLRALTVALRRLREDRE